MWEPYYDSYRAMIQFAGGVRRPVTLRAPDYRLDAAELEAAVTDRTKLILLNTPHNPTGHVFDRDELEAVADVARRHDLVVVTDEVYEHLTFDDHEHVPMATLPGMFERTLTISSSGKTFSLTGWKIGWATGPTDLVAALSRARRTGCPTRPGHPSSRRSRTPSTTRAPSTSSCARTCRSGATTCATPSPRWAWTSTSRRAPTSSTTDVTPLGHVDGKAFCAVLAERAKVVAIPNQVFYEDDSDEGRHLVRWAFCKEQDVLEEGIRRLRGADLSA